jgi:hypothetical protein
VAAVHTRLAELVGAVNSQNPASHVVNGKHGEPLPAGLSEYVPAVQLQYSPEAPDWHSHVYDQIPSTHSPLSHALPWQSST